MKREHSIHVGSTNNNMHLQSSQSIHTTLATYICREDGSYYWQHCRKEAEDDIFIDADGIQLDLFGKPVLNKEFIMKEILSV